MIASLGMYDPPHLRAANDTFWQEIRDNLGYGPDQLTRDMPLHELWTSPQMLFAQTCGRPYRLGLWRDVTLLGTPDYQLDDCPQGYYFSVIISASAEPPRTGRVAINGAASQSGWAALYDYIHSADFPPHGHVVTGSHAASITAVAQGTASIAAIDAQTYRTLKGHHPEIGNVHIIGRSPLRPALPFVTARHQDAAALRAAVSTAIQGGRAAAQLGIAGLIDIPHEAYMAIPDVPQPADVIGAAS